MADDKKHMGARRPQGRLQASHHGPMKAQPERRKRGIRRDVTNVVKLKPVEPGTPKLRIYALGGLEEIGRNCTVLECGNDIIIIDCGLMFPEEGMPGIDYIVPNFSSLRGKEKNIRGMIVTHGHMDHVGGIPLTMHQLGWPTIFTAPLSAGIIRKRQEEFGNANQLRIQEVRDQSKIQLGRHFQFEPFHVNHNISDAFGAAIHTPYGTILFTGDFKFDYTPYNDEPADLQHIAGFGVNGVLALFEDSTDSTSPGHQISESKVYDGLESIFATHKGRLIFATFSSLLTRIEQILDIAGKYGRKVLIEGRSMNNNIELAHRLGYMQYKAGTIIEQEQFRRLPDDKAVVICTGAQGEKNAALMRIATGESRAVHLQPGDGVVFSSSVIPGNERTVQGLKDTLVKAGAKVYHSKNMDVHAGGHAKQEDLKLMMRLVQPLYLVPIHGNRFMLEAHKELGIETGIPAENCLVAENGQVIECDEKGMRLTREKMISDYVMVDGLGVGDVSEVVLRDRIALAEDGIFIVIATIDKKNGECVGMDVISRGFVQMKDNKELIDKAMLKAKDIIKQADPNKVPAFEQVLKDKLRNDLGEFLYKATQRRPMILPVLVEV
jgi:ribonuclease J